MLIVSTVHYLGLTYNCNLALSNDFRLFWKVYPTENAIVAALPVFHRSSYLRGKTLWTLWMRTWAGELEWERLHQPGIQRHMFWTILKNTKELVMSGVSGGFPGDQPAFLLNRVPLLTWVQNFKKLFNTA